MDEARHCRAQQNKRRKRKLLAGLHYHGFKYYYHHWRAALFGLESWRIVFCQEISCERIAYFGLSCLSGPVYAHERHGRIICRSIRLRSDMSDAAATRVLISLAGYVSESYPFLCNRRALCDYFFRGGYPNGRASMAVEDNCLESVAWLKERGHTFTLDDRLNAIAASDAMTSLVCGPPPTEFPRFDRSTSHFWQRPPTAANRARYLLYLGEDYVTARWPSFH
jgi:hypothetical protein